MRVLVLGAHGARLLPTLHANGDALAYDAPEWLVSFGYPHIIPPPVIARFPGRIINVHIAVLPHNRGADPNFWSWYDDTPKGVTIHQITKGIDAGPILAQSTLPLSNGHTLRSSYDVLMREAQALFAHAWPQIRADQAVAKPQQKRAGSYHRQADKAALMKNLPGWDTPCAAIEAMGRKRLSENAFQQENA